jgi:ubiquinone/menaquinone biosynthesis C-methylase UbiE
MTTSHKTEESRIIADAFDALAANYDSIWTHGTVGVLQREQVWREIQPLFRPGDRVLEIGCGTGVDAVHLARAGVRVHATDISPFMLSIAHARIEREGLAHRVTLEHRSIEQLSDMEESNAFDGAFSNFGAFNCTKDLCYAASTLARLIRPGGRLALCFMSRFCLWETMWYLFHGHPHKAFRRMQAGRNGLQTSLSAGLPFRVFYPSVRKLTAALMKQFKPISSYGIGVLVPPSCMEQWSRRRPEFLSNLAVLDEHIRRLPILRGIGDHHLAIFTRTDASGKDGCSGKSNNSRIGKLEH